MNSSIGNAGLLYIVIFIFSIIVLIIVGAVSYTKAYRIKNRIVQSIEYKGSYEQDLVVRDLRLIGYQTNLSQTCDNITVKGEIYSNLNNSGYKYCVYKICVNGMDRYDECIDGAHYYKVTTYIHINLPLVENLITVPVKGETKILGKEYDY